MARPTDDIATLRELSARIHCLVQAAEVTGAPFDALAVGRATSDALLSVLVLVEGMQRRLGLIEAERRRFGL